MEKNLGGEYEYLTGQPEKGADPEPIETEEEKKERFEKRMFLQRELIEYAVETRGITEIEWVEKYARGFAEYYDNSNVSERFEYQQDKNPKDFYEDVQHILENFSETRKEEE